MANPAGPNNPYGLNNIVQYPVNPLSNDLSVANPKNPERVGQGALDMALAETFTGSNIHALILRRNDPKLLNAAQQYIESILQSSENAATSADLPPLQRNTLREMELELPDQRVSNSNAANFTPLVCLQTITVSTFRSKIQVRSLGHVNPTGIARGSRTIAGTLILTEFDRDSFWNLISLPADPVPSDDWNIGDTGAAVVPDQLPPFDLLLLFQNERGKNSYRFLYDVELVTNGVVYSIHDMYVENTLSFMCSDVTPLIPIENNFLKPTGTGGARGYFISAMASVNSGKEVVRRYRMLKRSRDTNR